MNVKDAILGELRDLYRAQHFVIEEYEARSKDERLSTDLRKEIQVGLEDHRRHKERIETVIKDLGGDLPSAAPTITSWISSIKEAVTGRSEEPFRVMQSDLATEHGLIDSYKVLRELAIEHPNVLEVCRENMMDDENHARLFEKAALQLAKDITLAA